MLPPPRPTERRRASEVGADPTDADLGAGLVREAVAQHADIGGGPADVDHARRAGRRGMQRRASSWWGLRRTCDRELPGVLNIHQGAVVLARNSGAATPPLRSRAPARADAGGELAEDGVDDRRVLAFEQSATDRGRLIAASGAARAGSPRPPARRRRYRREDTRDRDGVRLPISSAANTRARRVAAARSCGRRLVAAMTQVAAAAHGPHGRSGQPDSGRMPEWQAVRAGSRPSGRGRGPARSR